LWDVASGESLRTLTGTIGVNAIQTGLFTPDSSRLLVTNRRLTPPMLGGNNYTPAVFDVATGKMLYRVADDFSVAVLSPDGKEVVASTGNSGPGLWDVETGERRLQLGEDKAGAGWVAFSSDGKRAATAGSDVFVWDVATGKRLAQLRGSEGGVGCIAFSPDGTRLAMVAGESVRVVEIATGRLLGLLPVPHLLGTPFVTFVDDESVLTHVGETMRIRPVDALAEAKRRRPRELTKAEREKYEVGE
jgi:hypothetical protein